jgi:ABC-type multidrug transport system ATPase subunit
MIRIANVTRRFGKVAAVDRVTLDVAPGRSLALWGTNGAGKTTLIRCVLGLLRFSGAITVGGSDVARDGKRTRMRIGYVPQELAFYDDLGVDQALRFFGRLKGLRVDADASLASVGLRGHEHKRIRELSGGMKQRLALAIALLGDPPVLVLDEVTASLDAIGRDDFVSLLKRLSGAGRTMLFASHRVEEVAALADHVAVLERGRVANLSTAEAFVANLGRGAVLHLVLPVGSRERAMRSLAASGFDPRLNGVGLLVPVHPEQKAAPFRVLAEARVPVEDFELVSHAQAAALATHDGVERAAAAKEATP